MAARTSESLPGPLRVMRAWGGAHRWFSPYRHGKARKLDGSTWPRENRKPPPDVQGGHF